MADGMGLGDAYGATIERIKAQNGDKSRLGMAALMWISHAERPLKAEELCHALAIELGSRDFNVDNLPSISTLVSCCQGLITVDKEASTVRLIHFTLQEYLSAHPDIFSRPHAAIAEVCLTYLNSEKIKAISANSSPDTLDTPLLEYCSIYWGVHAKKELSDCARSLALELLQEYDDHVSSGYIFNEIRCLGRENFGISLQFSGLHCASFFGIVGVVAALVEQACYDINEGDFWGHTPLVWAAHNGHDETVKMLLGREEVCPDKPDILGQTPFSFAAQNGHEGVVNILLEREEVDPDKPDIFDQTPLMYAAWHGHDGVVKVLLEQKRVNPDKPGRDGRAPISHAAAYGREGVVRMLLGREEVNPDKPNVVGKTPLMYAACWGHLGVAKMLLGRQDVNPDKPDDEGRTPLVHAAQNGHMGVVKILLGWE